MSAALNLGVYDLEFLSRMMGASARVERVTGDGGLSPQSLQRWVDVAAGNPEKRAAGHARLLGLLEMLPTPEDAARTPVEVPRRDGMGADDPRVISMDGREVLGVFNERGRYEGLCPCESGSGFGVCHGGEGIE